MLAFLGVGSTPDAVRLGKCQRVREALLLDRALSAERFGALLARDTPASSRWHSQKTICCRRLGTRLATASPKLRILA